MMVWNVGSKIIRAWRFVWREMEVKTSAVMSLGKRWRVRRLLEVWRRAEIMVAELVFKRRRCNLANGADVYSKVCPMSSGVRKSTSRHVKGLTCRTCASSFPDSSP